MKSNPNKVDFSNCLAPPNKAPESIPFYSTIAWVVESTSLGAGQALSGGSKQKESNPSN